MMIHYRILAICIAMSLLYLADISMAASKDDKPNFIVILCDDLGWGDLGCYGHPHIQTPHLDRLAAGGIRFTNAYSAAVVCSPSRAGLLTGRNPNRAGIYDWIPEANQPIQAVDHRRSMVHLQRDETTLPKLFSNAGYSTALVGKWHCNAAFNRPEQPQPNDLGFQHWFATQNNADPSHLNPRNFVRNGAPIGRQSGFSSHIVVQEAIDWLAEEQTKAPDKQFFLYIAFHEPHEPIESPDSLVTQYKSVARSDDEAQYFANVTNMDAAVGKLVAALQRLGVDQDTVIYFSSDNGPETLNRYPKANRSFGSPGKLKGMKLWTTEGGCRVPCIISTPLIKKNAMPEKPTSTNEGERNLSVLETPISSLDLLPTFASLAGVDLPVDYRSDGSNIRSVLEGNKFVREKPLMWVYYNSLNQHSVAMRDGRYKIVAKLTANGKPLPKFSNVTTKNRSLIESALLDEFEIYDLEEDEFESDNLVGIDSGLFDRLRKKIESEYKELLSGSHVWETRP